MFITYRVFFAVWLFCWICSAIPTSRTFLFDHLDIAEKWFRIYISFVLIDEGNFTIFLDKAIILLLLVLFLTFCVLISKRVIFSTLGVARITARANHNLRYHWDCLELLRLDRWKRWRIILLLVGGCRVCWGKHAVIMMFFHLKFG